jgi:hypothetical protein
VACSLLSLDAIEPYLGEIGFQRGDASDLRAACREYLDAATRENFDRHSSGSPSDPERWLDRLARDHGKPLASRIANFVDRLVGARPDSSRHGWTELMVSLVRQPSGESSLPLQPSKVEVIRRVSDHHLKSMKQLDDRVEQFGASLTSQWDKELLERDFFPNDDEDVEARRFDPKPWLWDLLSDTQWRTFAENLRSELTPSEIDLLVTWARSRPGSTFGDHISASV